MARIIETIMSKRRIIKLSTDDILSVVREYQNIVYNHKNNNNNTRKLLEKNAIFIPEDI